MLPAACLGSVAIVIADLSSGTPPAAVTIVTGRTNVVIATLDVGAPVERAVPSAAYASAVAADADQRWADAEALYRAAASAWRDADRMRPSIALELAIAKADRERQASQTLAARVRASALPASRRAEVEPRGDALEEARLLRGKLMSTRAMLGRIVPALYARARDRLQQALRAPPDKPRPFARRDVEAEIYLLLCATYGAAGEHAAGALARAHVTEAERADPANTVAVAACAAALDDTEAALRMLELAALRPDPPLVDRSTRGELYLANDWDRLRGTDRFESLFR